MITDQHLGHCRYDQAGRGREGQENYLNHYHLFYDKSSVIQKYIYNLISSLYSINNYLYGLIECMQKISGKGKVV